MACNDYYLVTLGSTKTPVRHKYTNLTDEWYGPTGVKYTDTTTINNIKAQATDQNKIGNNTIYQQLLDLYTQGKSIEQSIVTLNTNVNGVSADIQVLKQSVADIKTDTTTLKQDTTNIKTNIGDIKTVLDKINGEVV